MLAETASNCGQPRADAQNEQDPSRTECSYKASELETARIMLVLFWWSKANEELTCCFHGCNIEGFAVSQIEKQSLLTLAVVS